MKIQLSKVSTNMARGLNTAAPHLIDAQEAQVAENFLFDQNAPYVRKGIMVYGSVPAPVVALKKMYQKTGSSYFIAFAGGGLYAANLSGSFVSVSSEAISGQVECSVNGDALYFTDKVHTVKYFNGSSIDFAGLSSPIFRKQIADFEANELQWEDLELGGTVTDDFSYNRINLGDRAGLFSCSSPATQQHWKPGVGKSIVSGASTSGYFDFTHFASNVSSDIQDIVQVFVTPWQKSNISSLILAFNNRNADEARMELAATSSWVCMSNDFSSMTIAFNKQTMLSSENFIWSSARPTIYLTVTSTNPQVNAQVSLDNWVMLKTPPIVTLLSSLPGTGGGTGLYFGSGVTFAPQGSWNYYLQTRDPNANPFDIPAWAINSYLAGVSPAGDVEYYYNLDTVGPYYREYVANLPLQGAAVGSAPLPNDEYFYKMTFIKRGPYGIDLESNPCYQTSGILVSSDTASYWVTTELNNLPVAPAEWGVTAKAIYRRPRTESDYKFVGLIADNATTRFVDYVPSTVTGRALEEDHWPPPIAKIMLTAFNQNTYYFNLIEEGVKKPSRLKWSKTYAPYYVPLENVRDITPNDGTEGTGMFEFMNLLYLLKERSTWMIDESGSLRQVNGAVGCVATDSVAQGPNEVFWLSEEGIIKYNLQFRNISKDRARMTAILDRLPKEYLPNAKGVFYNGFYLLSVTDEGSTTNNLVLCYDNINDRWSTFPNLNVNCWTAWQGFQEGYRLFFGNNSGQICELFAGQYDISTPVYGRIRTKEFGLPTPTEAFKYAYLHTENLMSSPTYMSVTPYLDFVAQASETVSTSHRYDLIKMVYPQGDGASFNSIEIITSGRIRLNQIDIYARQEELR